MTIELKPCPFCGEELYFEEAGFEHPYSDTCPLDSLYIEDRHVTAWNDRADAALRREREPIEPVAWLPTSTVKWLTEYDGPACAIATAAHNRPIKTDGGVPLYTTSPDALALVAAAYRDAAEHIAGSGHTNAELNRGRMQAPGVLSRAHNAILTRTHADAEAHLTALLRAERDAALAGAVTVKPLVWDRHPDADHDEECNEHYGGGQNNLAGQNEYAVYPHPCADGYFVLDVMGNRCPEDFPSVEAAKAAAQADYEARIRAALIPTPDTLRQVREAIEALGAMPEGYCFCSKDRIGDDSKIHEPECRDLRAALALLTKE